MENTGRSCGRSQKGHKVGERNSWPSQTVVGLLAVQLQLPARRSEVLSSPSATRSPI